MSITVNINVSDCDASTSTPTPPAPVVTGSEAITHLQPGVGAIPLSVFSILKERVSVTSFGADPDAPAAVNRAAFNNAINSLAAGGTVKVPSGTFDTDTTAITLASSAGIVLEGDGISSIIRATSATGDVINVMGQFVTIAGLKFASSVPRTSGSFVNLTDGAHRFMLRDFMMQGASTGVTIPTLLATATIMNGSILETVAAIGEGIRLNGGMDVSIRDILMDGPQGSQPVAGIRVKNAGDVTIEDCNIIGQGTDLYVDPGAGQGVSSLWANNSFFDTAVRGIRLNPTGGGTILRSIFDQCWVSSHVAQGALAMTSAGGIVDGLEFIGCHMFLNGDGAFYAADSGVKNVSVIGGEYAGNVGCGINFNGGSGDFSVIGAKIGACSGFGGNTTGIAVGSGSTNFVIEGNLLQGNTTAASIAPALGPSKIVRNNIGFVTENAFTASGTTDAGGQLTVNHGCYAAPGQVVLTPFGASFRHAQIVAVGATTITIVVLDAAGSAVASTAVSIYCNVKV